MQSVTELTSPLAKLHLDGFLPQPDSRRVSFDVPADAYGRFMGRFSEPLAVRFADSVGMRTGQRALDVGCGPGALTARLVERLGAASVCAVDPSSTFVSAARERLPGVDVRQGTAEALPYDDNDFDLVLAQLVVHFMRDPVLGLREMARVAQTGGAVGACVWDHAGGAGPLAAFWDAVRDSDPRHPGEADLPGTRSGHLGELAVSAGLLVVDEPTLTVDVTFATFSEWWEPFTLGVGPAGAYVAGLDDGGREALRLACHARLPDEPFTLSATAWCVLAGA
jgi:trans-aconitate methyltransferase